MPYPERRYDGQGGEVSATWRQASQPPDLEFPSGTMVRYLATGASTDALFGLFHWQLAAVPSGARPHLHRSFTESFHVLDGTIKFHDGQRWFDGTAGDFIHVPAGGIHGFGNASGRPASMLIHFAPGAPREGYFEGLLAHALSGPPPAPELAAFFEAHDNIWVDEPGVSEVDEPQG